MRYEYRGHTLISEVLQKHSGEVLLMGDIMRREKLVAYIGPAKTHEKLIKQARQKIDSIGMKAR